MKLWRVISCLWVVGLLMGCTFFPDNATYRRLDACKQACKAQYIKCDSLCRDNCPGCGVKSRQTTLKRYRQYIHERTVSGQIVGRELQSYRDPLQCRKITCACLAENAICMQHCTGDIHKKLQAAPICC